MIEYKYEFNHAEAQKVLGVLGAEYKETVESQDLYLKDSGQDIWKLVKAGTEVSLVHLAANQRGGFERPLKEVLDANAAEALLSVFSSSQAVMTKRRAKYALNGSELVLDKIDTLGEFLEIYPKDDMAREELFKAFNIQEDKFITRSYYQLWLEKTT